MKNLLLLAPVLLASTWFVTGAEAQPSGTLAHCCNFESTQLSCSAVESHGNHDHSTCKTDYDPYDGKTSKCTKKVTSNGQVMYEATIEEAGLTLFGTVSCAGGQELKVTVITPSFFDGDSLELRGRGFVFNDSLGTCEMSCVSPTPSPASCTGILSIKS